MNNTLEDTFGINNIHADSVTLECGIDNLTKNLLAGNYHNAELIMKYFLKKNRLNNHSCDEWSHFFSVLESCIGYFFKNKILLLFLKKINDSGWASMCEQFYRIFLLILCKQNKYYRFWRSK